MKRLVIILFAFTAIISGCTEPKADFASSFVRVSEKNPGYFELTNGDPYIPIGCNIAALNGRESIEHYVRNIAENGGNYGRVWLNSSTFEIEEVYGEINQDNLENIRILLDCATRYNVKIKLCIESFRHIVPGMNRWDTKASYHVSNGGPFEDMSDYIHSEKGRQEFLKRLQIIKDKVGESPAVFAWELWNEMNAVDCPDIEEWNVDMLREVKKMFPNTMVVQSLGSLDRLSSNPIYEFINKLPENEVMQVHRYLDEGAELEICSAPVDLLCEDAVRHLLAYGCKKPALLAESGAVQPSHSGPSLLYPMDKDGIIFHDVLFAPFFSGAAGPGHIWHWDHYLEKYGKWHVLQHFASAVEGINPIEEEFVPSRTTANGLNQYVLDGNDHALVWLRDSSNTWRHEFIDGVEPSVLCGKTFDLSLIGGSKDVRSIEAFDPWSNYWSELAVASVASLPDFSRSLVLRITL